jgi:hypothetical protein
MSNQAIPQFPERVERAIAEADRLAAQMGRDGPSATEISTSPEYQELVRLKVILEVETSRTLSETAEVSSELAKTELADQLASMEED